MRMYLGMQIWLQRWTGESHDVVCHDGVEVQPPPMGANAGRPMPIRTNSYESAHQRYAMSAH